MASSSSVDRARRLLREFWAAIMFFLTGVGFVLLTAFGPVYFGPAFDSGNLGWIGVALIIVAVYTTVGVSIPRLVQGQRDVRDKEERHADQE